MATHHLLAVEIECTRSTCGHAGKSLFDRCSDSTVAAESTGLGQESGNFQAELLDPTCTYDI